jgi:hypothetical protein
MFWHAGPKNVQANLVLHARAEKMKKSHRIPIARDIDLLQTKGLYSTACTPATCFLGILARAKNNCMSLSAALFCVHIFPPVLLKEHTRKHLPAGSGALCWNNVLEIVHIEGVCMVG